MKSAKARTAKVSNSGREKKAKSNRPQAIDAPLRSSVVDAASGMAIVDFDGTWLAVNQALCDMLGYGEGELLAANELAMTHPEDATNERAERERLQTGQIEHYETQKRLVHKQGHTVDVRAVASMPEENEGKYCVVQFEAAAAAPAESPRATKSRWDELADDAPVLIWSTTADRRCEYVNKSYLDFTGRQMEQELGQGWMDNLHPEERDGIDARLAEAFSRRAPFEIEHRLRRRDNNYRWLLSVGVPRIDVNGELAGYVGSSVDITERRQVQMELQELLADSERAQAMLTEQTKRLHHLADSDPLTGVLNRRSFREQFEREWARAVRHERPISCVMLDVDFFKKVNDTHGHAAGDAILKRLAELLLEQCRPSDLICRWGGEEFCVMVPETNEAGAAALAERLRTLVAATKFHVGDQVIKVTSTFGVVERSNEANTLDELIEQADQALHIGKHSGRNRVIRFASESAFADMLTQDSPVQILSEMTAGELVTPTPCVHCDETTSRAIELLLKHNIGSAPIIDDLGKLVGFISERDLMHLSVTSEVWSRSVREVMKTNVVCYEEDTPGHQIFQFLGRVSIHRIVVVKNGRPLGIISPSSLLACFRKRVAADANSAPARG